MTSVGEARYNSSYSTTVARRGCTAETRVRILQGLKDWAKDKRGAKVYWMDGMAGTGKTTIGYSLCEWLADVRQLGGNFFCSRGLPVCRQSNNIVPTLAHQLARYSPAFRSALCQVLEEEPEASKLDIRWQFEKLIEGPMRVVKDAIPDNVVVVIDALDECDDGQAFRLFLETLLKLAPKLPFKFFLTSRPEPIIREKMLALQYPSSVLHLHDIAQSVVGADIEKYLTDSLCSMSSPPSSDQVKQLTKRAGRLFIYAATAVRYILPYGVIVNSTARLQTVLGMTTRSSKQHEELNGLYTIVLSAALNNNALEDEEKRCIRLTLWTAVCAREPMTVEMIASLLSLQQEAIRASLEPLRSVLFVEEGEYGRVSPFHASFPDYLLDSLRSEQFYCHAAPHHEVLANGCFDLMKAELRFNICNLMSSFVFDRDVPSLDDRVNEFISPALSYTCRYWGEHLARGNFSEAAHERLSEFLAQRLLFWMEVLNLKRQIVMGAEILQQAQNWLKVSIPAHDLDSEAEIM